jgi:hypothetical protein
VFRDALASWSIVLRSITRSETLALSPCVDVDSAVSVGFVVLTFNSGCVVCGFDLVSKS